MVVKTTCGNSFSAEFTVISAYALAFRASWIAKHFVSGPESQTLQKTMPCFLRILPGMLAVGMLVQARER